MYTPNTTYAVNSAGAWLVLPLAVVEGWRRDVVDIRPYHNIVLQRDNVYCLEH